jgi:hypothetical protein
MSLFCNKTLRDSNKNLEHLFGGWTTKHIFVFTPGVGGEHFLVDLFGRHVSTPTPSVGVVHMWVVCT